MSDILKISDVQKAIETLNTKGVTGEKVLILQGETFEHAMNAYARICVNVEKKGGWIKTSDRMPEGDEHDEVLVLYRGPYRLLYDVAQIGWLQLHPSHYAYWKTLPEIPTEEITL